MRAFKSAEENGATIPEIVCFEKQSDWGGLWNYDWRTGTDAHGEPVHASMYRNLWSNGLKECLDLADYSFDTHFGKPIASYPTRPVHADYIKGRAQKSGIRNWVRFNTPVRMVTYSEQTSKFTVTVHDRTNDVISSEDFDHVVVATGHFSTPNVPFFKGLETFKGRFLHSHDVRDVVEFKDHWTCSSWEGASPLRMSPRNATSSAQIPSLSATGATLWVTTGLRIWKKCHCWSAWTVRLAVSKTDSPRILMPSFWVQATCMIFLSWRRGCV